MSDLIDRQAAIDAAQEWFDGLIVGSFNGLKKKLEAVPPAQPEQLEQCPIYGGMCAYPSDQCYDCPRHAGAKMEVTT